MSQASTSEFVQPFPVKRPSLEQVQLPLLTEKPLVSIIVPSYNQGRFIKATIDSILSQEYRPIQIHVIDGGSKDETVDVLKSFGDIPELNWVSEPDKGVVHAVNKGFLKVTGDIIGIQSSDDCYLPGAITRIIEEMKSMDNPGLIYGDTMKIDAAGNEILKYVIGPYSLENFFHIKTWIPQPSAFFRKEMLELCGGWDDSIPYAPDTDLWIRMAFRCNVHKIDHYLSQRRMHDAQRDTQYKKIVRDYTKMIEQSPDIAQATPSIKNAAHAGKYLIRLRYRPVNSDWYAAKILTQAAMCDYRTLSPRQILYYLCLPFRRAGSKVKQMLLGKSCNTKQQCQQ